jgi:hypothetical protein
MCDFDSGNPGQYWRGQQRRGLLTRQTIFRCAGWILEWQRRIST